MDKGLRFYNPKTKEYELINSGGLIAEEKNKVLTGDELYEKLNNLNVDSLIYDKKINNLLKVVNFNVGGFGYATIMLSDFYSDGNLIYWETEELSKDDGAYLKVTTLNPDDTELTVDSIVKNDLKVSQKVSDLAKYDNVVLIYDEKNNYFIITDYNINLDDFDAGVITLRDIIDDKASISYVDEQVEQAGKVDSVNGQKGDVKLTARDIPYDDVFSVETELRSKAYKWDLDDKADMSYVDNKISSSISDIGLSDYLKKKPENLGRKSFNDVENPGFYRIWDSSTSPLRDAIDYYLVVHNYNGNVVQIAHTLTTTTSKRNRVFTRTYCDGWDDWKEMVDKDYIDSNFAKSPHTHLASSITPTASQQFVSGSEKEDLRGIKSDESDTYTTSTPNNRVLIGSSSSRATSKNSTVIASEGGKTSQARSAVIASRNSETDGANYSNRSGNVILASNGVKTPSGSRNLVVGGSTTDTNATPSTSNIKWKLDGVEGTLWVDSDVEIGNMKVKKEIDKKADKEIRDSKTNKKYYLDIYDNRVFLREVK